MKKQAGKGGLDSIAEEQEADAGPTTKPPQIQKCASTQPLTSQPLSRTKRPALQVPQGRPERGARGQARAEAGERTVPDCGVVTYSGAQAKVDASNLPYLHRNPAV